MERNESQSSSQQDILIIAKGAGIVFFGLVLGTGIRYVFQIIVARNLGPELLGLFILGFAVFRIAGMVSMMGLPHGIIRYVAIYNGKSDKRRLKGIIKSAHKIILISSSIVSLLIFLLAKPIAVHLFNNLGLESILRLFAIIIPFFTLTSVNIFSAQGFKRLEYKIIPREIFEPLARIFFVLILFLFGLRLYGVMLAYLISVIGGMFLSFYFLKKIFPAFAQREVLPQYETKRLLTFSWPLLFVQFFGQFLLILDNLMLGYFKTSQDVGIYSAAQRTALLGSVIIASFNSIFGPIISDLYYRKEISRLKDYFKTIAKWAFTFSFPVLLALIFFSKSILNIFGQEFLHGATCLIILSFGWIIYSAVGTLAQMLIMTGRQKLHLVNVSAILVLNIISNIILIPKLGIIGAAITTSSCLVLLCFTELIQIYLILNIHPYKIEFLKPFFAGIITSGILLLLIGKTAPVYKPPLLIIILGITFCIYILLIYIFGLNEEDKTVLRKIGDKILNKQ
ncbi:flippase [Acidobacteriota bacterium]